MLHSIDDVMYDGDRRLGAIQWYSPRRHNITPEHVAQVLAETPQGHYGQLTGHMYLWHDPYCGARVCEVHS